MTVKPHQGLMDAFKVLLADDEATARERREAVDAARTIFRNSLDDASDEYMEAAAQRLLRPIGG